MDRILVNFQRIIIVCVVMIAISALLAIWINTNTIARLSEEINEITHCNN